MLYFCTYLTLTASGSQVCSQAFSFLFLFFWGGGVRTPKSGPFRTTSLQNLFANRGIHGNQANLWDRHVGSTSQGTVKKKCKTFLNFHLVHTTIPNYSRVTRILAHTRWKFQYLWVNWKFKPCLFFSIPLYKQETGRCGKKVSM